MILTIVLQLPTAFSTVTCCTGLQSRRNRLYYTAQVYSRLYCIIQVCVSTVYDVRTTTKSPNGTFLGTYPPLLSDVLLFQSGMRLYTVFSIVCRQRKSSTPLTPVVHEYCVLYSRRLSSLSLISENFCSWDEMSINRH